MAVFEPVPLNLPVYPLRLKDEAGQRFVFDVVRKKFLILTPEEWVRQHLVHFLVREKQFPKSLIQLEGGLKYNGLQKRSDILIYNQQGEKLLLAECKAPSVKITQDVFDQIARYNFVHRVQWLLVSNGMEHYCCKLDWEKESYQFLPELPLFSHL
ncbi:MAG: hypothetical protein RLZ47_1289 [Bacteroidota bacterium]|jgi:hypothetical protein